MKGIRATLPGVFLTLLLVACNSSPQDATDSGSDTSNGSSGSNEPTGITGFLAGTQGATPISHGYTHNRPTIEIENADNTVVLIYNHGTARPQQQEDCEVPGNQVPSSLKQSSDDQVLNFYLCSSVIEERHEQTGEYIYKRLAEVEGVVDELLAAGIQPSHIFLTGHSAGGWTSLMAASYFPDKFNGAVAFAPAFAGPRSEAEIYPRWRGEALPRQIEDMLTAYERHALVFAYYDDAFERPEDLEFLVNAYAHSIRMVAYECPNANGHLTHLQDCREEETVAAIEDFISDRVSAAY